jgi:hypothetical protein
VRAGRHRRRQLADLHRRQAARLLKRK